MTQPSVPNNHDAESLLRAARRAEENTREHLSAGATDLALVAVAITAAALVTGTSFNGSLRDRLFGVAFVALGLTAIISALRTRIGLGQPIPPATVLIPTTTFVVNVLIGLSLHGGAHDAATGISLAGAAAALGLASHARWLVVVGITVGLIAALDALSSNHGAQGVVTVVAGVAGFGLARLTSYWARKARTPSA